MGFGLLGLGLGLGLKLRTVVRRPPTACATTGTPYRPAYLRKVRGGPGWWDGRGCGRSVAAVGGAPAIATGLGLTWGAPAGATLLAVGRAVESLRLRRRRRRERREKGE